MRVLVLAPQPFYQHRGTPIAVKALLDALSEEGHQVDLITYPEGEDVPLAGGKIYRIPRMPGVRNIRPGFSLKKLACDLAMLVKVFSLLRRQRYDLIHAVEESAFIGLAARKLMGVPFLYDMDSSLAQQMMEKYSWLRWARFLLERSERRVVRGSVGVIAVCRSIEETVRGYAPDKPLLRLEDVSLLSDGQQEADAANLTLGVSGKIIMYVGNLEKYQGIDLLLEGFQRTAKQEPDANLVIIGGRQEDIALYAERSNQLGIRERVHFMGPRPITQLGAHLAQADVLVSPRIRGYNTPMKIYSYLDSGRPLVATRMPTHTQVLDDEIAYLVSPDPDALGDGLARLLREKDLAATLAGRAKERVRQEFTLEAFRRKLLRFYRDIETELSAKAGGS